MSEEQKPATPAATWRVNGEPDPHGSTYDGERAQLAYGNMTDDELANAVFMHNHRVTDVDAIMRGEPSSMALLTAAKDRIRWLSRALAKAQANAAAPADNTATELALARTQFPELATMTAAGAIGWLAVELCAAREATQALRDAVGKEMDPSWKCNSYHPSLHRAMEQVRADPTSTDQYGHMDGPDFMALSDALPEGTHWGDPITPEIVRALRAAPPAEGGSEPAAAVGNPTNSYLFKQLCAKHGIELGKDTIAEALAKITEGGKGEGMASDSAQQAAPVTYMSPEEAQRWAWGQVKKDCGLAEVSIGESSKFMPFFFFGWNYRGQYDLQRAAPIYQEMDPSGTWETITKERHDDMITLGESGLVRVVASPAAPQPSAKALTDEPAIWELASKFFCAESSYDAIMGFARALLAAEQPSEPKCKACAGNNGDVPCAYGRDVVTGSPLLPQGPSRRSAGATPAARSRWRTCAWCSARPAAISAARARTITVTPAPTATSPGSLAAPIHLPRPHDGSPLAYLVDRPVDADARERD